MSTEQQKEAETLFTTYAKAKEWWEGLDFQQKQRAYQDYFPEDWAHGKELTMGQIKEIWESEIKPDESVNHDKALYWWKGLDDYSKQELCNNNFMGVHPDTLLLKSVLFLWEKETQPENLDKEVTELGNELYNSNTGALPTIYVEQPAKESIGTLLENEKTGWEKVAMEWFKMCDTYETENKILKEALGKIANWELPSTGKFWDREEKEPMSYEAQWGSNGVRDYIKKIAIDALKNS